MNNLYNQLNRNINQIPKNNIQQVKSMLNLIRNANNPQALLQTMINNNPNLANVMNIIRQNGGNPKDAFYNLAKQKGVNPDEILNMLKWFLAYGEIVYK